MRSLLKTEGVMVRLDRGQLAQLRRAARLESRRRGLVVPASALAREYVMRGAGESLRAETEQQAA